MQLKNLKDIPLVGVLRDPHAFDDFLDHTPDNRVTISTPTQAHSCNYLPIPTKNLQSAELSSDNIVTIPRPMKQVRYNLSGDQLRSADDEAFAWERDQSGIQQDTPSHIWSGAYHAIAVCNYALQAIEQLEAQGHGDEVAAQKRRGTRKPRTTTSSSPTSSASRMQEPRHRSRFPAYPT